ncbi:caspase family protein [Dyadobacter diqingensis]|uniref:caspase family protein n=1 Tax=Dyadobacter diqingensis TaxID=2938121 RepID=UPI0020C1ADE9|nr:caspase family protein [Dyadobacter diqingensis]
MKRRQFLQSASSAVAVMPTALSERILNDAKPILNVILAVDLSELKRKADRTKDLVEMGDFLTRIGKLADMDVRIVRLVDNDFTPEKLIKTIQGLGSMGGTKNSLIVYFSGHGNNDGESLWPSFRMGNESKKMKEIAKLIVNARPKVGLLIGDCCNNVLTSAGGFTSTMPVPNPAIVKKLLWDFGTKNQRLSIQVSSASKAEFSFSQSFGSVYKHCFMKAFNEKIESNAENNSRKESGVVWEEIFVRARVITQGYLKSISSANTNANEAADVFKQTPYHAVTLVSCPEGTDC